MVFKVFAAPPTLSSLPGVIDGIFTKILPFIGIALFGMFVYGGVMWLMSAGDPQKMEKAQGTLLWAVIGAVIIALAYAIISLMEVILGVPEGTLKEIQF